MITFTTKGDYRHFEAYLRRIKSADLYRTLDKYGIKGVDALSNATPTDTGRTASSWYYEIVSQKGYYSIRWHNSNVVDGRPIAILLQYGHGTGTGGYVQGRDFIMPAIRPIFDQMVQEFWREVTK